MTLEQARVMRDALTTAIQQAEAAGSTEVVLTTVLDQALGQAIAELQAEIAITRANG